MAWSSERLTWQWASWEDEEAAKENKIGMIQKQRLIDWSGSLNIAEFKRSDAENNNKTGMQVVYTEHQRCFYIEFSTYAFRNHYSALGWLVGCCSTSIIITVVRGGSALKHPTLCLCVNNKKLLREEKDLIVTKICANQQQL